MFEIKFVLTADLAAAVGDWARGRLRPDPNGSGDFHDEYTTSTVYFDTFDWRVFRGINSFGRAKFRVRRYDEQPTAYLERKLRTSAQLIKRRTPVSLGELDRLSVPADSAWCGDWFRRRIERRHLQPRFQVSYRRLAREMTVLGASGRLTLDTDLRGGAISQLSWLRDASTQVSAQHAVLELKYDPVPPAAFKELIGEYRLTAVRFSKYRSLVARSAAAIQRPVNAPSAAA